MSEKSGGGGGGGGGKTGAGAQYSAAEKAKAREYITGKSAVLDFHAARAEGGGAYKARYIEVYGQKSWDDAVYRNRTGPGMKGFS